MCMLDCRHQVLPTQQKNDIQWLVPLKELCILFHFSTDATFQNRRLSRLLIFCCIAIMVVKQWGQNAEILANQPGVPRPSLPVRRKITHNHNIGTKKWIAGTAQEGQLGSNKKTKTHSSMHVQDANSEMQASRDEDDVVMFFWENFKAIRERHAQEEQNRVNGRSAL